MAVMRFLFALLLGFVAGVGGTDYFLNTGAGDLFVRRAAVVQDLEQKLRDSEAQRDQLARKLDDLQNRAARMEDGFKELERRFNDLQRGQETPPAHRGPSD